MTLSFATKLNNIPTYFPEKIWAGLKHFEITEDLARFLHSEKSTGVDIGTCLPKIHTIRSDEKNRWIPGNKIHFKIWEGKPYRSKTIQFAPVLTVKSIQGIEIKYTYSQVSTRVEVFIDGEYLGRASWINCKLASCTEDLEKLCNNDGFDSVNEFFECFSENFIGKIIHWTNKSY